MSVNLIYRERGGHAQATFATSTLGLGSNDILAVCSSDSPGAALQQTIRS